MIQVDRLGGFCNMKHVEWTRWRFKIAHQYKVAKRKNLQDTLQLVCWSGLADVNVHLYGFEAEKWIRSRQRKQTRVERVLLWAHTHQHALAEPQKHVILSEQNSRYVRFGNGDVAIIVLCEMDVFGSEKAELAAAVAEVRKWKWGQLMSYARM